MMTCREVAAIARDHVDGKLPGRARLSVRLHLLMCEHCRRYLRQLRATVGLLRAEPDDGPTADEEQALLAGFRAARGPDDPDRV